VNETETMQIATIKEIEEQTNTIDRIEGKLEDISDDMERAAHLMKGIESFSYYMFSGGTKKKDVDDKRKQKWSVNLTVKITESSSPIIEFDALFKNENLKPCIIVLNAQNFQIINPKTDKLFNSGHQYSYYDIEEITVSTRNEYLQISFNNKKKPIGLCTSYRQIITNQFYTRTKKKGHDIKVKFQHGSHKFDYQDEWLYKIPPVKRGSGTLSVSDTPIGKLASLFKDNQQDRLDAEEIDKVLDRVSDVISNIIQRGQAVNQVIIQQTERLQNLEGITESQVDKARNLEKRMDKQG